MMLDLDCQRMQQRNISMVARLKVVCELLLFLALVLNEFIAGCTPVIDAISRLKLTKGHLQNVRYCSQGSIGSISAPI